MVEEKCVMCVLYFIQWIKLYIATLNVCINKKILLLNYFLYCAELWPATTTKMPKELGHQITFSPRFFFFWCSSLRSNNVITSHDASVLRQCLGKGGGERGCELKWYMGYTVK